MKLNTKSRYFTHFIPPCTLLMVRFELSLSLPILGSILLELLVTARIKSHRYGAKRRYIQTFVRSLRWVAARRLTPPTCARALWWGTPPVRQEPMSPRGTHKDDVVATKILPNVILLSFIWNCEKEMILRKLNPTIKPNNVSCKFIDIE